MKIKKINENYSFSPALFNIYSVEAGLLTFKTSSKTFGGNWTFGARWNTFSPEDVAFSKSAPSFNKDTIITIINIHNFSDLFLIHTKRFRFIQQNR